MFVDDWRVLDHYQSLPLDAYLFTPQNGHHVPVTLALFALDYEFFGGRMQLLALASLACVGLAVAFLYAAFRAHDGLGAPVSRIAFGFACFCLFWAASCHDLLWGLNQGSLQAVALLILGLGWLGRVDPARPSRRLLGLSVLAALLATLSQSMGVAAWAALFCAALVRRLPGRVVAGIAAGAAATLGLYARSIPPHPYISFADSLAFAAQEPLALAQLALGFVGSAPARVVLALGVGAPMPEAAGGASAWVEHTRDLRRFALGFGTGGLLLFGAVAIARWRRPAPRSLMDSLAIGLMAFGVAGALLVAFTRAPIFGPAAVVQIRFITWSTLFWIGAACALVPRSPERAAAPRAVFAALFLPIVSACMIPALGDARAFHAARKSQASKLNVALLLGLHHDALARNVSLHEAELVYRVSARLESEGRHPFEGPRAGLRGAPLRERLAEAGVCAGATGGMRPVPTREAHVVEVWGWLAERAGQPRPRFVVLADGASVIRGLADFAAAPPHRAHPGGARLPWAGFVADYDALGAYAAYAVLPDGRTACRIAPSG